MPGERLPENELIVEPRTQVTVRYKRLETVGQYCNVEVEATAVADLPDKLTLTDEGPRVAGVDALRVALKVDIDRAIAEAKEQKRREKAEDRHAAQMAYRQAEAERALARGMKDGEFLDCYRLTWESGHTLRSTRLSEIAEAVVGQAAHNRVARGMDVDEPTLADAERSLAKLEHGAFWVLAGVGTVERVKLGKPEVEAVLRGEEDGSEEAPF